MLPQAIPISKKLLNNNMENFNPNITAEELKQRMDAHEKLNLIDVREPWEFDEFNIGATLIPLATLPMHIDELQEMKNDEIIVHCAKGGRSANAQMILQQFGFTKVRNLVGGMENWKTLFGSK